MRPRGVAPKRMPKADATGLAPKKSATNTLDTPEGFVFWRGRRGRRPPHLTAGSEATSWPRLVRAGRRFALCRQHQTPTAVGSVCLHFFGETSERRPWASKREWSPGCFCPALL